MTDQTARVNSDRGMEVQKVIEEVEAEAKAMIEEIV